MGLQVRACVHACSTIRLVWDGRCPADGMVWAALSITAACAVCGWCDPCLAVLGDVSGGFTVMVCPHSLMRSMRAGLFVLGFGAWWQCSTPHVSGCEGRPGRRLRGLRACLCREYGGLGGDATWYYWRTSRLLIFMSTPTRSTRKKILKAEVKKERESWVEQVVPSFHMFFPIQGRERGPDHSLNSLMRTTLAGEPRRMPLTRLRSGDSLHGVQSQADASEENANAPRLVHGHETAIAIRLSGWRDVAENRIDEERFGFGISRYAINGDSTTQLRMR